MNISLVLVIFFHKIYYVRAVMCFIIKTIFLSIKSPIVNVNNNGTVLSL